MRLLGSFGGRFARFRGPFADCSRTIRRPFAGGSSTFPGVFTIFRYLFEFEICARVGETTVTQRQLLLVEPHLEVGPERPRRLVAAAGDALLIERDRALVEVNQLAND